MVDAVTDEKLAYDEMLAALGIENRILSGVAYCTFEVAQNRRTRKEEFLFKAGTRTERGFSMSHENSLRVPPTDKAETLGRIISDLIHLSFQSDPFVVNQRNPNPGEFPGRLSPGIITSLERLGWSRESESKGMVIECFLVPDAIKAFFIAKNDAMGKVYQVKGREFNARTIAFGVGMGGSSGGQYFVPDKGALRDRGDKFLVGFANSDDHENLLALALNDPNPSDPAIYKFAHDDPGPLGDGIALSQFLQELRLG